MLVTKTDKKPHRYDQAFWERWFLRLMNPGLNLEEVMTLKMIFLIFLLPNSYF